MRARRSVNGKTTDNPCRHSSTKVFPYFVTSSGPPITPSRSDGISWLTNSATSISTSLTDTVRQSLRPIAP